MLKDPTDHKPNWPRIRHGINLCEDLYPGVVGSVLAQELESWSNFGYRLGGKPQIERLLDHLEKRDYLVKRAASGIVHRIEVEG